MCDELTWGRGWQSIARTDNGESEIRPADADAGKGPREPLPKRDGRGIEETATRETRKQAQSKNNSNRDDTPRFSVRCTIMA